MMDRLRRLLLPTEADRLMASAVSGTGLVDFGDPPVDEPLAALVGALHAEARLSVAGSLGARQHLRELLEMRLRLEAAWKTRAADADQPVRAPIVITGMPRSGSMFLHGLLAQDPGHRAPRLWEVMFPALDGDANQASIDARVRRAENRLRLFRWRAPAFSRIQPVTATSPQECIAITSYSLCSDEFTALFRVPSYVDWLRRRGAAGALRFHRRFLQHLQASDPSKRWVLKSPDHAYALADLIATYPDARVVLTHRDPLKVMASTASLLSVLRRVFSRRIDAADIGREVWALKGVAERMISFQDRHPALAGRIVDVRYDRLASDPLATVKSIYRRLRLPFSDEAERRIRDLLQRKGPRPANGHAYSLERFGLDRDRVRRSFDFYYDRFGLAPEA